MAAVTTAAAGTADARSTLLTIRAILRISGTFTAGATRTASAGVTTGPARAAGTAVVTCPLLDPAVSHYAELDHRTAIRSEIHRAAQGFAAVATVAAATAVAAYSAWSTGTTRATGAAGAAGPVIEALAAGLTILTRLTGPARLACLTILTLTAKTTVTADSTVIDKRAMQDQRCTIRVEIEGAAIAMTAATTLGSGRTRRPGAPSAPG